MQAQQTLSSPSIWIKIIYALGQLGWSLAIFGVGNLIPYFYMPPEEGATALFPTYIYQGYILGIITIIGLIGASGRLFDAFTDPLIASLSDRSKHSFGRRRIFMAMGFIPCCLLSFLAFYPPIAGESTLNGFWLTGTVLLFYFFLTVYLVPYTAWISELGHTEKDRLFISTIISVTFALGVGIGNGVFALQGMLESDYGMSSTEAFQSVMFVYAIIAAVLMAMPLLVNEYKYCLQTTTEGSSIQSVKTVFSNRNFQIFAISDLMYWLALTFILMGLSYYITVLLKLDKSWISALQTGILGLSFLFYVPINILANKYGKKPLMSVAFIFFIIVFGLVFFLGKVPLTPLVQASLLLLFATLPVAIFGILPNVIVADIADEDGKKTGNYNTGMFYAGRAFTMKIGISLANLIFPSLLILGKSVDNDFGIRMTGIAAMLFCTLGFIVFQGYKDRYATAS